MSIKQIIGSVLTVAVLAGCKDDATSPLEQVLVVSTKSVFRAGHERVVVTITNESDATVWVGDHSELASGTSGYNVISVAGCEMPLLFAGWAHLPPGNSIQCEHATAAGWPPGDYRLLVVIGDDMEWPGQFVLSNVFQLSN